MSFLTPSRRRWFIVALIFGAMVLNYFDRQIVSILKPTLKTEFSLDDSGYARLVNVFAICYAGMYPVAGWLVDRFGTRGVMLTGIIGWSTACLGAGLTRTFGQLAFFRGMLGMAEPLAYPAQLRAITIWCPGTMRATANSLCVSGGSIGAILAPPLVASIALKFNWHLAFVIPGVIGFGVAVLWWFIYRDPPVEIAAQSIRDNAATQAFTWPQLWRTRSLWGILLCRFISDPVWYFCLFWLPGYLQENSGLTLKQIGMYGWIPFLVADIGGIGSAAWSDRLVKGGTEPLRARKIMLTVTALCAPVCALTPHLPHAVVTLILFSIVCAVCLSWLFSMSVVIAETFPAANIGSVMGITAGFGTAGAILFNTYVGKMMQTVGAPQIFAIMALLHPLAMVVLWTMVRPEKPAEPKPVLVPASSFS
ncbi:MAG: transporter [Verrucomicrobiales bacterium]|nr:transporter [Verrucomicrobiales bacterium]